MASDDAVEIRHEDKAANPDAKTAAELGTPSPAAAVAGAVPSGAADAAVAPPRDMPVVGFGAAEKPQARAAGEPAPPRAATALPRVADGQVGGTAAESGAPLRAQPGSRLAALVAAMVLAAGGAGAALGAWTAGGFARHPAAAAAAGTARGDLESASMRAQLAALTALKAGLERANRSASAQFARIDQRLDGLEHAQSAPAAKLARMADALDHLAKQRPANTGDAASAANAQLAKIGQRLDALEHAQAAPAAQLAHVADTLDRLAKQRAAGADVTGSLGSAPRPQASAPSPPAPVLSDWVLEGVHNGRAMVDSRYGGPFMVAAGSVLPGLGRVEHIERQDGRWVVVTARGLITVSP